MQSPLGQEPGMSGVGVNKFVVAPSDGTDQPFRFLKAVTAGTVAFVNFDGTVVPTPLAAGEYEMCAGRRVNLAGTTAGMTIHGYL